MVITSRVNSGNKTQYPYPENKDLAGFDESNCTNGDKKLPDRINSNSLL